MPLFGRKEAASTGTKGSSSERDLRRLRRIDLLELLLDQIRENEEQSAKIVELDAQVNDCKERLDAKEERIERLLKNLDARDAEIVTLSKRNRALAHAQGLLDVDEILEIGDIAVDMYLTRISGGTVRPVESSSHHEFQRASDHMPLFKVVEQNDCLESLNGAEDQADESDDPTAPIPVINPATPTDLAAKVPEVVPASEQEAPAPATAELEVAAPEVVEPRITEPKAAQPEASTPEAETPEADETPERKTQPKQSISSGRSVASLGNRRMKEEGADGTDTLAFGVLVEGTSKSKGL